MTIKTIFLDRDGVINKEVNYLYKIDDFEFIDGVFEACQHFQELSYKEISNKLDEPINNVKVKLLRAKKLLAEIIQGK